MQREDYLLSKNFGLFEMCHTDNLAYMNQNHDLDDRTLVALCATAHLMESVRTLTGHARVAVHSAYRCPELNGNVPGASITSQHPKGEACDFHVDGQTVMEAFNVLQNALRRGQFWCGQLIYEVRGGAEWVHVSLPEPWRVPEKCGQIMVSPRTGVYELIARIAQIV